MSSELIQETGNPARARRLLPFAVLVCAWTAFLLPAAIFGQWFTLDMGGVFIRATGFPDNVMWALSPYDKGGRYFPAYWLYNFSLFRLFSTNLAAHFAVQGVLFTLSLTLTCYLFYRITSHRVATLLFGVLACLGGAVAENMYTLGKGEPLAYLFVISALVIFHGMDRTRGVRSALQLTGIALLVALAMWSKETSLVLLVFAPAVIIVGLFVRPHRSGDVARSGSLSRYSWLFLWIVVGLIVSKAPYLAFARHGDSETYVAYKIDATLVIDNLLYYAAQQPDVLALGLASLILLPMAAVRMRSGGGSLSSGKRCDLMFASGLLMMAWGYYVGLLIWRWPMGYYMLLPSIVFKFTAIYGFLLARELGLLSARTFWASILLMVAATVYAALHSLYVVTSQSSYSRMYTEAISRYLAVAPRSSRLIFESFPFYAEQVTNTKQVISLIADQDRVVGGIADLLDPEVATPEILKLLNISPQQMENNERSFPRKDDYLLVMTGNKIGTWSVRGVTPHYSDDSILLKDRAFDMIPVAENRSFSPGVFLNTWTHRLYFGSTYIGYKLYRVTGERPRLLWRGRYPDGWIGKSASIRLFPEFGKRAVVTVSTPSFNSPNKVTVTQDGKVIRELALVEGKESSFEVANSGDRIPTRIEFTVDRTVVPKELKLNKDKREIGVLVRIQPRD